MDSQAAYQVVLKDLHKRRREIDAAITAVEAMCRTAPQVAPEREGPMPPRGSDAPQGRFKGVTIVEASRRVLEEAGKPMHVSDILRIIREGGVVVTSVDPANTVGSIINRAAKHTGQFKRVGRGTWALAEPKMAVSPLEQEPLEPFRGTGEINLN